jgi:hypothetical protein
MNDDVFSAARARSGAAGRFGLAMACAAALALMAACGGGGDGSPAAQPMATTLTGTAATGAPFAGAAVQVIDATGAAVCDTTTLADGTYQCTLQPTVQRPLVIRASKDDAVLYSATAASGDTRANVTPLTHIIVSRLAPNGDPAALSGAMQTVTATALQAQSDTLLAALQPLLTALGLTIDPLGGQLVADGTGQDKLLDTISVSVRPNGTTANIEVTVKTLPTSAGAAPVTIKFSSSDTSLPQLPASVATALAPVPTPALLADLFSRLNACYALPLTQRVNATNDNTNAVGTASDVIGAPCRSLFVGDDPANFISNKVGVGRNANNGGAWASLFRSNATGLQWTVGDVEFFRANGDVIISYKWTDRFGNQDNDLLSAHDVGGVLKLVGNTNTYPVTVRPFSEDRDLINSPASSYYTTGYNIQIDNRTSAGVPIFDKVQVTTPLGQTLTMLPTVGLSYLVIAPNGTTPSGSPVLRLAAEWRDTAKAGSPVGAEPALVYADPPYTAAEIAALADHGVWTVEFFHADPSMANVVQYHRTVRRAETIAEIRTSRVFPALTAAARAELITETQANGYAMFTTPNTAELDGPNGGDFWTVPVGALAPTSVTVYGRAPFGSTTANQVGARFNDGLGVASTARKIVVPCTSQTADDKHCDAATPGFYATGTIISTVELWARSAKQVEVSKKIATYQLQ